jgi:gliding motility-associated-like protein
LPNVFSPNNDGVNDLFKPLNVINQIEYISFKIFDRWNELVFEGSAENNFSWDGFYKNKEAQVDSYVWILEYKILNNKRSKKGIVSLLR